MTASFVRRLWVSLIAYTIGIYAFVINHCRIEGAQNIPKSGGVLLASNHISGYETVFLPAVVLRSQPLQMVWAPAKEELFNNPFIGGFFRLLGAFPVKRGRDIRAGKTLHELLQSDKVMIFPEGTRHKDGVLGKGNRGVGKLIYDSRPTVIPTALSGLNHWKFPGVGQTALVRFGAPLDLADLLVREDCKETHLLIVERLMAAIAALLPEIHNQS